jgi:hypothetical protein
MGLPRNRLEATPRIIEPTLAAQMLFGGAGTSIGWLLVAFGSIFGWIFAAHADLTGWRFREGAIATVAGVAEGCSGTGYTIGGSEASGGTPVYQNHYRYQVAGQDFGGWSYATGDCLTGENVTIEYLPAQPGYSRIRGMRHELLGPWALLAALIPGIGLAIAIAGMRKGIRRIRLLRDGVPAAGLVTAKVATGAQVLGRAVYKITLDFTARDGSTHTTTVKTNEPERLEDEEQECILYLPSDPDYAIPLDALPGKLSLDHAGRILPGPSRAFLVLPVFSLLLNAWFAWRHWS